MAETEKQTKSGWFQSVIGAILLALVAGGTVPWWWQDLQAKFQNGVGKSADPKTPAQGTASTGTFNLLGKWAGSRDCDVRFFLDDGKNIKGVCDKGLVSHSIVGVYLDNRTVTLSNVRRDQNGCETTVDGTITFRDKDTVVYSQAGWDGCGVRTPPGEQNLVRDSKL